MPDTFTSTQALLFQGLTAQYLVTEYRDVRPGDRVLVHSAAGGVGLLLVQWLKHLGAWVVGTTSSDAKGDVARAAGADAVINYGGDYTFLDELLSLTRGQGVDLAFDAVGAATLVTTLKGLARGGTAVSYGQASGPAPAIEPAILTPRAWRLAAGSIFSYVADSAELQRRAAAVIEAMREGWLRVSDGTAFDLDRVADAHRAIEGRGTHGKLYLTP
jgi:NADPH2:quinone reductase